MEASCWALDPLLLRKGSLAVEISSRFLNHASRSMDTSHFGQGFRFLSICVSWAVSSSSGATWLCVADRIARTFQGTCRGIGRALRTDVQSPYISLCARSSSYCRVGSTGWGLTRLTGPTRRMSRGMGSPRYHDVTIGGSGACCGGTVVK